MTIDRGGLRTAVLISAALQAVAPLFHAITGIGTAIGDRGDAPAAPEEPAAYAFSIWAVIFALALAYGARQMRSDWPEEALYRRIRPASATLFALSMAWMITAQIIGNGAALVIIIVAMLAVALRLLVEVRDAWPGGPFQTWVVAPLAGLYAGWLTLAAWLNASSALRDAGGTLGLSPTLFAVAVLTAATASALVIAGRLRGSLWYTGAIVWGLLAVLGPAWIDENVAVITVAILAIASVAVVTVRSYGWPTPPRGDRLASDGADAAHARLQQ